MDTGSDEPCLAHISIDEQQAPVYPLREYNWHFESEIDWLSLSFRNHGTVQRNEHMYHIVLRPPLSIVSDEHVTNNKTATRKEEIDIM